MMTLAEMVAGVATLDDEGVEAVLDALQARHDELHAQRESQVNIGSHVIINDVQPTFLQGLCGEVVDLDEGFATVLLDVPSTGRLRFCRQSVYRVGAEMRFSVYGVPASCCWQSEFPAAVTA